MTVPLDDRLVIDGIRDGDAAAMERAYQRFAPGARRVASALDPGNADDLVSEAFVRVFDALRDGRGPDRNLAGYLATTVRRLHLDRARASARESPSSDRSWLLDRPHTRELLDPIDAAHAVEALGDLPERWREVLWYLDVEGMAPADLAPRLRTTPARISALAYRAREGLRRRYLDGHLDRGERLPCRWTRDRLSSYVRQGLSPAAHAKVGRHLDECAGCAAQHALLVDVNAHLGAWIWPIVLTGFGALAPAAWPAALVAGSGAGAAGAGGAGAAGAGGGVGARPPRPRLHRWLTQPGVALPAAATAVTVVAAAVAIVTGPVSAPSTAEPPPPAPSTPPGLTSPSETDDAAGSPDAPERVMPAAVRHPLAPAAEAVEPAPRAETTPPPAPRAEAPTETRPEPQEEAPPPEEEPPEEEPPPEETEPEPATLTALTLAPVTPTQVSAAEGIWSVVFTPQPTIDGDEGTIPLTASLSFPDEAAGFISLDSPSWTCASENPDDPPFVPDPDATPFLGPGSPLLVCTTAWDVTQPLEPLAFHLQPMAYGDPPTGTIALAADGVSPFTVNY